MKTSTILILSAIFSLYLVFTGTPTQYHDDNTTKVIMDEDITHDEALKICEDLGLIYDYEAEGYDTSEFCYAE